MKLHKNIYLWYVTTFLSSAAFTLPIWVIFNTETLGLSHAEAYILSLLPWGLSVFLEIPSGALSDRYGRAKIYTIGLVLYALSTVSFIFFSDFLVLLGFQLLGALGIAMISGGIEALVHDSIGGKDKDTVYAKVHGNKMAILFVSRVVTVLIGGYAFTIDPRLPYILTASMLFVGIVVALFYKEVRIKDMTERTNLSHIAKTFSLILHHKSLVYLFSFVFLLCLMSEALFAMYQPYLQSINIEVGEFGLLYATVSVASAFGAMIIAKLMKRFKTSTLLLMMMLTVSLTLVALITGNIFVVYAAIVPSAMTFGMTSTLQNTETQKLIGSSHQATALSIASLTTMLPYLLAMVGVGLLLDMVEVPLINIILLIATLFLTIPFVVFALCQRRLHRYSSAK